MLFNAFFAAAKVNNNAFLEFRCQNNTVRVKWSDTDKPYTIKDANMLHRGLAAFIDVSRPPPTAAPSSSLSETDVRAMATMMRPGLQPISQLATASGQLVQECFEKDAKKPPYRKTSARVKSLTLLK